MCFIFKNLIVFFFQEFQVEVGCKHLKLDLTFIDAYFWKIVQLFL
jgi:hypothetical protein